MSKSSLSFKEKLGQRSTGFLFSAGTFSQKIGWSIGPAISMYLLGYFGFFANEGQGPGTVHGLRLIMSWIPAVFAFLAGTAVFFYRIDSRMECHSGAGKVRGRVRYRSVDKPFRVKPSRQISSPSFLLPA